MNKEQKEQIADDIIEIIDWYQELPEDYQEVNELMYARQRLSGLVANYSRNVVGEIGKEWKKAKRIHGSKKYQLRVLETHKHGISKATAMSKANTEAEFTEELELEGMYLAAKEWSKSMYAVLDSMNQHISHLKEELKYSRYTNEK